HRVALLGADPLGVGDHPADRDPVAVAAPGELAQRAVDARVQGGAHLLERMRRDEQADRFLLGRKQLAALELARRDRRMARATERSQLAACTTLGAAARSSGGRRVVTEVENRALTDERVLLGLLTRC